MLDAHFQIRRRPFDIGEFDARMQTQLQRRLNGFPLRPHHIGMVALAGQAQAHGIIGTAELHHVDPLDRQDRFQVFHAFALLNHHRDHHLVQRLDIGGGTALAHRADIAAHADTQAPAGAGGFRAHRRDTGFRVGDRTQIGEQDALEARANRPHGLMGPLRLLDLDHAAEVFQFQRPAQIIQVVHGERRIFGGEFDVVVIAGLADQFDEGGPGGEQMRADRWLVRVQQGAQAVMAHDGVSLMMGGWLIRKSSNNGFSAILARIAGRWCYATRAPTPSVTFSQSSTLRSWGATNRCSTPMAA